MRGWQDVGVPSPPPTVSRRRVLVGAVALAALGAGAAACGAAPPPPDLDDLTTALDRARADSKLAAELASTSRGRLADVLADVAAQRSAHAEALSDEIVRLTGQAAPSAGATSTTPSSAASVPAPTVDDVIGALRASADSATQAAGALTGYRAGLLASIAASCACAYTVALAGAGGGR
ncbi:hypothetical protein C6A87_010780 [Mycobacterium sp. ITM-2016-00317]|uniref:hypothetical protein n=1 Tax=Mycobacterium sp. ITM-2016-00317 TaxID=2099694 RepID=UPI000D4AEA3D|nr:hypothetical protein [Mycobacterium sp. ITM-2016-00317]WNG89591.1 hypothetical protein C6A87_010780 [Mycobacterium sp. ITM-2016-00317]